MDATTRKHLLCVCETAIFIALAFVLNFAKLEFAWLQGGSISLSMIPILLLSLRRGGPPSNVIHSSRQVTPCYRPGRALPVAEVSPWEERLHLLSYSLLPGEEAAAEQLRALVGRTVLYKDSVGARVIGVLASLSETRETGIDLTLTLSETDWRECNEST